MSNKKQELLTIREHLNSTPVFWWVRVAHFSFSVSLCFEFPCCDVRYDFCIKTMFGASLPPVVCRRTHVFFTLVVFVCV